MNAFKYGQFPLNMCIWQCIDIPETIFLNGPVKISRIINQEVGSEGLILVVNFGAWESEFLYGRGRNDPEHLGYGLTAPATPSAGCVR